MDRKVFRDETGFQMLKEQWNPLLKNSSSNNLFLTWEWQHTWWRCLGEGELWMLAWQHGEDLVGIAPLYRHTDANGLAHMSIVGCVEVSDYLDLIVAVNSQEAVYNDFLDWLVGPEAPAWDVLHLCNLPQNSPTHRLLPVLAAARGLSAQTRVEDVCPIIVLPSTWDAYLQDTLSKKQRHEVRRKLRRIENEAQVSWYRVSDSAQLASEVEEFIRLHQLSAADKQDFMTAEMQGFFREIATVMHNAGHLYLAFIDVDRARAATVLGFSYEGSLLLYNSGYNPDSYAELSPGIVLNSYMIQDAINRGLAVFDFLQGDEVYKYRFGATDTVVYTTEIHNG